MNIIVTGAAGGLGRCIVLALQAVNIRVIQLDAKDEDCGEWAKDAKIPGGYRFGGFDVSQKYHWEGLRDALKNLSLTHIDGIINCAGINRNEWFEEVNMADFYEVMDVNAFAIIHGTQVMLEAMKPAIDPFVLNIVSNAAHMPMTSSLAYNASKAAALMITKQMAHELTPKHGITVFSISPNKLEGTGMSKAIEDNVVKVRGWTPEYAKEYQKKALMHGRETSPAVLADFIAGLIASRQYRFMSGTDIPFGK